MLKLIVSVLKCSKLFCLNCSRLLEIDIVREAEGIAEKIPTSTREKKGKLSTRLQQILIKLQDLNDEKIHFGQILAEKIEKKFRTVERDFQNNLNSKPERTQSPIPSSSTARKCSIEQQILSVLPLKRTSATGSIASSSSSSENNTNDRGANHKRMRRTRTDVPEEIPIKIENFGAKPIGIISQPSITNTKKVAATGAAATKKQKKTTKKAVATKQNQPIQEPVPGIQDDVDPDEETYCLCGQISYGEMILCENDLCGIEWFHFSCVSLQSKPKGKW